ncbi:MAG: PAS domain S-box protein, partial [Deltaproteobacteria bacterium]
MYIEVTDSLEPDPYLSMPESDIVTPSGRLLRYVHPVTMTRIVNKLARERFGVLGKITSFKPVHPENMPDTWEREALQAFEQRKSEVSSVQDMGGNAYMRLMRPLLIEKACLQCHTGKEGDVCGGIGVSIPMQPLWAIERKVLLQLSLAYGAIWLMGLWGLVLVARRLRRSQEKVLHSKRFTENIVATVPSGLLVISGESEVLSVNRSFCELFDVKRQQVVGQTVDAVLQTIGLSQKCRDAIAARMPFRNLECLCSIPGKAELTLNLTLSGIRIAEEEEEEEALLVIEDITERKRAEEAIRESEERFTAFMNNSPAVAWMKDPATWTFNYINNTFEKIFNITREVISKKTDFDLWPEEVARQLRENDLKVMSSGKTIQTYEDVPLPDGTVHNWLVFKFPMHTPSGKRLLAGTAVDITERKKMEEKLQMSEEKYRTMIEQSNDMIWTLDRDGALTYFNQRCEEITGHRFRDWEGKSFAPLIVEDELPSIFDIFQRVLKGESLHYEVHMQASNNRSVLLSVNTAPILQASEIMGTVSFGRDITDMRKAEEQLSATRDYLENLLDFANAPIIVWDPDTTITRFNHAFERLSGNSSGEVIGKKLEILFPESNRSESMKKIDLTLKGEYWESVEIPILCKNGDIRIVLWNSANIYAKDGTTLHAVIAQGIDITDRKKQEQIQKILYNISQATVTTDSFEVFIAEIQKQLGAIIDTTNFYIAFYDASTGTISMPFMADQKDRFTTYPAAKTMTRYMMESQKPLLATKDDMLALLKSGHIDIHGTLSEIWLGVPLKSQGKVTGAVVVQSYEDPDAYGKPEMTILEFISNQISLSIERRKAEEEIIASLEKAQESDRLKSAFLANMSHEIRTPLNSVLGFSELISDPETEPSEREKYSKIILNSGQQLLGIISDVLDISKIEAGQILITRNPFNLQHLLEEIKEEFEPKANLNGLNLMIDSRLINAELVLISDREKIKQILSNLVGNAIKFTNQGSIIIGLYQNGTDIQFYIEDTGIGIRKENYETVFERFRQVNSEKNRKYEGTGLGLAIAKSLVEMLGGRIWVESESGAGAT